MKKEQKNSQSLRKKKVKIQILSSIGITAICIALYTLIGIQTREVWNFFQSPSYIVGVVLISAFFGIIFGVGIGYDIDIVILELEKREKEKKEKKEIDSENSEKMD